VFDLAPNCDLIISDDRFINRHAVVDDNSPTPIISTLDLIKKLSLEEIILHEDLLDYLTVLRRSGYIFIPIDISELVRHLKASNVDNGKVVESAELKAIKENILKVRMTDWLQLPEEASWLDLIMTTFIQAIENIWRDGIDVQLTRIRSNWLLSLIEIRGWSHAIASPEGVNVVDITRRSYIDTLLIPPDDIPTTARVEYLKWIDESILAPIKEQEPDLFTWLVEKRKALINNLARKLESEGDTE
ncbi:HNH endonuclease, partial [bacterium]|nr:HNH endonuclease [bacterium]